MTAPTGTPGAPTDGGTPTGPAPATGTQQPTTPAPTGSGTQPAAGKTDLAQLPDDVRKLIEDLRNESAKHRTDKQTAAQAATAATAQRDAVLKALGLNQDGTEQIDPAKLTDQVAQFKAVAWEAAVESNVVRLGHSLGLDIDALLDSNSFLNSLEGLVDEDPGSGEFRTKLEAHLKDFSAKNPTKFKAAAATPTGPARSGGDMTPGAPGNTATRPKSLMDAVRKALPGG